MVPFSNKKGLDIDPNDDEKFKLVPCVKFFIDFQYKTSKDFFCIQIALTLSICDLEKCSFFK